MYNNKIKEVVRANAFFGFVIGFGCASFISLIMASIVFDFHILSGKIFLLLFPISFILFIWYLIKFHNIAIEAIK